MNKNEYIKSLENVKLVIGNGFDLHCGLHTKYSDFYCWKFNTFNLVDKLISIYTQTAKINLDDEKFKALTVWDMFFVMNSSHDPHANKQWWCDIEKLLLFSLLSEPDENSSAKQMSDYLGSNIHWEEIKHHISSDDIVESVTERFFVDFTKGRMKIRRSYPDHFYEFLLEELKDFEKNFGDFINKQIHESWFELCNRGQEFLNKPYIQMAVDTIKELCNLDNLVAIDSFNYGEIRDEKIMCKFQNINGNTDAPIFGIDSVFDSEDERYIFTKTGRRIDSDLFNDCHNIKQEFENMVIYGHSLNKADYSYFFPLFDKMKLDDVFSKSVIVFAYSVYDKEKEKSIRANLRQSISNVMFEYAIDKKISNPKRFLDSLSTQKRIVTYEIPLLHRERYGRSIVDQDWEKIYKDIDSLPER